MVLGNVKSFALVYSYQFLIWYVISSDVMVVFSVLNYSIFNLDYVCLWKGIWIIRCIIAKVNWNFSNSDSRHKFLTYVCVITKNVLSFRKYFFKYKIIWNDYYILFNTFLNHRLHDSIYSYTTNNNQIPSDTKRIYIFKKRKTQLQPHTTPKSHPCRKTHETFSSLHYLFTSHIKRVHQRPLRETTTKTYII